jgi:hypothetical protein
MPGMQPTDVPSWSFIDEASIRANSGGPASRRRTEHVCATMLRNEAREIRLPQVIRAGLLFGDLDPLDTVLESLARAGYDDAERLRQCFEAPAASLLVRVVPDARWAVPVADASDNAILQQALLLGLCTMFQYDPSRPVLWTRASLTRRVELYLPAGFYA